MPQSISGEPESPDRRPGYLITADKILQKIEDSRYRATHPWTKRWPTAEEMAEEFGVSFQMAVAALRHLGTQGHVVKTKTRRSDTEPLRERWVPAPRALAVPRRPSLDELAAKATQKALSGEWALLPTAKELVKLFGISVSDGRALGKFLSDRGLAIKVREKANGRWKLVVPHHAKSIDPRSLMTARQAMLVDAIRRITEGEFRYRLPDGTTYERPFPSKTEMRAQYQAGTETVEFVRRELIRLGWLVRHEGPKQSLRVPDRVPTVDRAAHPDRDTSGKTPTRTRTALRDQLLLRIRSGEFSGRPFPSRNEIGLRYKVGWRKTTEVLTELQQQGWLVAEGRRRIKFVLADPLTNESRPVPKSGR